MIRRAVIPLGTTFVAHSRWFAGLYEMRRSLGQHREYAIQCTPSQPGRDIRANRTYAGDVNTLEDTSELEDTCPSGEKLDREDVLPGCPPDATNVHDVEPHQYPVDEKEEEK